MYPVRTTWARRRATVVLVLMVAAFWVAPALTSGKDAKSENPLLRVEKNLGHSVVSGTSSFVACGPVGPNCDANCNGTDCTFFTATSTGTGDGEPGGPFTFTGTATIFFGLNGSAVTVNGAANPDGTPAGFCAPTSGSTHVVFPTGSIDQKSKGEVCTVGSSPDFLGSPTTAHDSSVCISGTGNFAGIQCAGEDTSGSTDGVHFIGRGESAASIPAK